MLHLLLRLPLLPAAAAAAAAGEAPAAVAAAAAAAPAADTPVDPPDIDRLAPRTGRSSSGCRLRLLVRHQLQWLQLLQLPAAAARGDPPAAEAAEATAVATPRTEDPAATADEAALAAARAVGSTTTSS